MLDNKIYSLHLLKKWVMNQINISGVIIGASVTVVLFCHQAVAVYSVLGSHVVPCFSYLAVLFLFYYILFLYNFVKKDVPFPSFIYEQKRIKIFLLTFNISLAVFEIVTHTSEEMDYFFLVKVIFLCVCIAFQDFIFDFISKIFNSRDK